MSTDERFNTTVQELISEGPTGVDSEIIEGPVADWATDFDHTSTDGRRTRSRSWTTSATAARSPTPNATAAPGCRCATTTSRPSPTTPSTSRRARSCSATTARPWRWRPIGIAPPSRRTRPSTTTPAGSSCRRSRRRRSTSSRRAPAAYCDELLDAVADQDVVDAAVDYAQHIPVRVIADMLGFPPEDGELFRGFVHDVLEGINEPLDKRFEMMQGLFELPRRPDPGPRRQPARRPHVVPDRRGDGREQLDVFHIAGTMALLLIAGIDTTWSRHRRVDLAPRRQPRRPPAPGGRPGAAAHRDGGAAPGLRAGHDGPPGEGGLRVQRRAR